MSKQRPRPHNENVEEKRQQVGEARQDQTHHSYMVEVGGPAAHHHHHQQQQQQQQQLLQQNINNIY